MGKALYLLIFVLGIQTFVQGQGIEFEQGTFAEALQKAKKENKLVFLDAYASWCGPCKRLSREMFPREDVGTFFNQHFVSFKQDMEKGEGLQLRKKYPVSAFPTLFFIAPTGEVITKIKGAPREAKDFINFAEKAIKLYDPAAKYAAQYEEGNRDYEVVLGYVKGLNQKGESSLRVANEYLDAQENLDTEENLRFIYEAMTRLDSRIFDMFTEHRKGLEKLYNPDELVAKVDQAAENSLKTALEYEAPGLKDEAVSKYKAYDKEAGEKFEIEANMAFALMNKDSDIYLDHAKDLADLDDSADRLYELSQNIYKYFQADNKAMKLAEKWAGKAAEQSGELDHYYAYAQILMANEKLPKANDALDECIRIAGEKGIGTEKFDALKSKIGGS
jgi:thioredoxin-related protein